MTEQTLYNPESVALTQYPKNEYFIEHGGYAHHVRSSSISESVKTDARKKQRHWYIPRDQSERITVVLGSSECQMFPAA
jgi:hypothetical protein